MTIPVLVTARQLQGSMDLFSARFEQAGVEVRMPDVVQRLSESEMLGVVADCHGMIVGDDVVSARVLRSAPHLRIVSKWGVGIDNVDLEAARALGIRVTNTPDVFGDEVADVVLGYLVMLARQLHRVDGLVRAGEWPKLRGVSLAGKIIGIVGLGSIGIAVARRATVLRMRVLGSDPDDRRRTTARATGVHLTPFPELLRLSDVVSLNCPLNDETRGMMDRQAFARMKQGAWLINTARGQLLDEDALVDALESGKLSGAALDVFADEPLARRSRIRDLPSVILGSHNASNTVDAVQRVNSLVVDQLLVGLSEGTR